MQWVFAYGKIEAIQSLPDATTPPPPPLSVATSRFCEAILDFLADHKRASEAHIREEDFEGEAYSIYELFSTVWLQSKEAKVNIHVHVHIFMCWYTPYNVMPYYTLFV